MSKNKFTPFYQPYGVDKRVYISGPMTDYPDHNSLAFAGAASVLRAKGYAVCNPVETSTLLGDRTHEEYLRFDFERVLEADFLVALDGWEESIGAQAEIMVAIRIGTKVWRWSSFSDYDQVTYDDLLDALERG